MSEMGVKGKGNFDFDFEFALCVSTAIAAKTPPSPCMFPQPSWLRHRLRLVFPQPSWLRHRLRLVFPQPGLANSGPTRRPKSSRKPPCPPRSSGGECANYFCRSSHLEEVSPRVLDNRRVVWEGCWGVVGGSRCPTTLPLRVHGAFQPGCGFPRARCPKLYCHIPTIRSNDLPPPQRSTL